MNLGSIEDHQQQFIEISLAKRKTTKTIMPISVLSSAPAHSLLSMK
jgi:hypothetical protein